MVRTDNNPLTIIMSTPNLDATGHQWVGALAWYNFELEYQKGCDNMVVDVLSWVTTQLDPDTVKSILNRVTLGAAHCAEVHDPALVEGDQCLEQEVHVTTVCALVEMHVTDWAEAQRGDLLLSTVFDWLKAQKHRFEGTSGRRHLQQRRQTDLTESTEFCDSSGVLIPKLNAQRWDWRSLALCGPQGLSCCHSEHVPLRCKTSRAWPYIVLVVGALLVAGYDQPDAAVYQVLHVLLAAWRWLVQSSPTLNCGHCSDGPFACGLYQHRNDHGAE